MFYELPPFSLVKLIVNFCPGSVFVIFLISNMWFQGKSQGDGDEKTIKKDSGLAINKN